MRPLLAVLLFVVWGVGADAVAAAGLRSDSGAPAAGAEQERIPPPLPRWREGGTPHDPNQSLRPYALELSRFRSTPTSGYIASPAEYGPTHGVIFKYISGHWTSVVRDCVVALTADPTCDELAYVVVNNSSQQTVAANDFSSHGADMSKVRFIIEYSESIWLRDYGPHFMWQDGALAIVDSHYYPTRPNDNFIPTLLGDDHLIMTTYDMGLYYSGGNFQPGPERTGFVTSLITLDNTAFEGFDEALIAELYCTFQGIDTLHIMPKLPGSVDGTGHIDMWMYLVDENSVIISQFKPGSNPDAIEITENAVPYMEDLGFEVFRTPAWNVGNTHYTYTNAFRVNDRILVPTYGQGNPAYLDEDAVALAAWQAAAGPEVELVEINCYSIIPAAGAIHCIVMQMPRRIDPIPAVHVISPDGGEFLVSGTTHTIEWVATDTDSTAIPQIDLYYSADDGANWQYIATTDNSGSYPWLVPDVETTQARVKVVARADDADEGEGISEEAFRITHAYQTVYDFATGGGANKFGWGYQVYYWTNYIDGNRTPVDMEVEDLVSGAYAKLAYSDATGGDGDPNRYISPVTNYRSTHTFEFTIGQDPLLIDDIKVLWEGYGDRCTQVELYVWDYVDQQWCNGNGLYNQNRYLDSWAGNRDGYLKGNIQADFDRYIDGSGQMTFLLYGERGADESFHDYMSVTVSVIPGCPGDFDGDNDVDTADLLHLLGAWGTPNGDVDGDGDTDTADLLALLGGWGTCP